MPCSRRSSAVVNGSRATSLQAEEHQQRRKRPALARRRGCARRRAATVSRSARTWWRRRASRPRAAGAAQHPGLERRAARRRRGRVAHGSTTGRCAPDRAGPVPACGSGCRAAARPLASALPSAAGQVVGAEGHDAAVRRHDVQVAVPQPVQIDGPGVLEGHAGDAEGARLGCRDDRLPTGIGSARQPRNTPGRRPALAPRAPLFQWAPVRQHPPRRPRPAAPRSRRRSSSSGAPRGSSVPSSRCRYSRLNEHRACSQSPGSQIVERDAPVALLREGAHGVRQRHPGGRVVPGAGTCPAAPAAAGGCRARRAVFQREGQDLPEAVQVDAARHRRHRAPRPDRPPRSAPRRAACGRPAAARAVRGTAPRRRRRTARTPCSEPASARRSA